MIYDDMCRANFGNGNVVQVKLASPGTPYGPWRVILWANGITLNNWYIVNTETGGTVKIGRVGRGRGVNCYDRAHEECDRRNSKI